MLFSEEVITYNKELVFDGVLPDDIKVLNVFNTNLESIRSLQSFYRKFYNDYDRRILILGINPGRFGAGITGVPFTDTKRLKEKCGIYTAIPETHEPSSVFIYELIDAYGGAEAFYSKFYFNSVCPLGFTRIKPNGKEINYNYYDDKGLIIAALPLIKKNIEFLISIGCYTELCFCLGAGKNYKVLNMLNNEMGYFQKIIPLEHPRYIMQYKIKDKNYYIQDYLNKLSSQHIGKDVGSKNYKKA